MDPITAVSLATNILTFIDFTWDLANGTYKVYQSAAGTTVGNARVSQVVQDLYQLTDDIDVESVPLKPSRHIKALTRLAANCKDVSQNLLKILEKLKRQGRNSLWASLGVQWHSMMKGSEIGSLREDLRDYRSQILIRLNLILREEQEAGIQSIKYEAAEVRAEVTTRLDALSDELVRALEKANLDVIDDGLADCPSQTKADTLVDVKLSDSCTSSGYSLQDIRSLLAEFQNQKAAAFGQLRILRQLAFDEMYDREDMINTAEEGTFQWMIQDPGPRVSGTFQKRVARNQYLSWLNSGAHIFHVSGKAGSGKSTFMKFLWNNSRTLQELEAWASPQKLVAAHFCFWRADKRKWQTTLGGLYRSILFEVVRQCPDLVAKLFPSQCQTFQHEVMGDKTVDRGLFRDSAIREAFERLVGQTTYENYRFCFFIDGLDEFDGDSVAHRQLAQTLIRWTGGKDIKIICSGRPHSPYLDTFDRSDIITLHLHEYTRDDISTFSKQMFVGDPNFAQVKDFYLELVAKIVQMSDGVFLWAYLTVRLLLNGIGQGDDKEVLIGKLQFIPPTLNELYDELLNSVRGEDRQRCNQMLLITLLSPSDEPLSAYVYPLIHSVEEPDFVSMKVHPISYTERKSRISLIRRQIDGLTKGLLQVVDNLPVTEARVHFFHRTARDYLEAKQQSLRDSFSKFDAPIIFAKLGLVEFIYHTSYKLTEFFDDPKAILAYRKFHESLAVDSESTCHDPRSGGWCRSLYTRPLWANRFLAGHVGKPFPFRETKSFYSPAHTTDLCRVGEHQHCELQRLAEKLVRTLQWVTERLIKKLRSLGNCYRSNDSTRASLSFVHTIGQYETFLEIVNVTVQERISHSCPLAVLPTTQFGSLDRELPYERMVRPGAYGSFLHLAAFSGLRSYVLSEVTKREPTPFPEPTQVSLLFSAFAHSLGSGDISLVSALLERGFYLERMISVYSPNYKFPLLGSSQVPIWILVIAQLSLVHFALPSETVFKIVSILRAGMPISAETECFLLIGSPYFRYNDAATPKYSVLMLGDLLHDIETSPQGRLPLNGYKPATYFYTSFECRDILLSADINSWISSPFPGPPASAVPFEFAETDTDSGKGPIGFVCYKNFRFCLNAAIRTA